jgi:ribonuclease HI
MAYRAFGVAHRSLSFIHPDKLPPVHRVYTDGSLSGSRAGIGVFHGEDKARDNLSMRVIARRLDSTVVELTAIHISMLKLDVAEPLIICTDSLASMDLVVKRFLCQRIRRSDLHRLATTVCDQLNERPVTYINKVTSHKSPGNIQADILASQGRQSATHMYIDLNQILNDCS